MRRKGSLDSVPPYQNAAGTYAILPYLAALASFKRVLGRRPTEAFTSSLEDV